MTSNGSDSTPSLDRRAVCSNEESLASNAGLALLWSAPCSLNGILPITLVDKDSVGVVVSERSNQVSSVLGFGGPTAPSTLRLSLLTSDIGRTEGLDCIHRIRQLLRTKTRTWMPFVRRRRSTHQQCSDLWQEMAGTSLANKNRGEKLRPRVASILKSALKSNRWGGTLPNKAKMTPGNCLQALYPKGGQKYPRPRGPGPRHPLADCSNAAPASFLPFPELSRRFSEICTVRIYWLPRACSVLQLACPGFSWVPGAESMRGAGPQVCLWAVTFASPVYSTHPFIESYRGQT